MCDGTTPGSPVLADGHTLYTPGLSENRGGTSIFYDFDRIGNLWTADGTTKNQLGYIDFYSFGGAFAAAGSTTPFGYGGGNGCQTDADAGLILMGHRYYDPRTGRFLTQDPAKDGANWYSYCGNNPVSLNGPTGLTQTKPDEDQTQQMLAAIQLMRDAGYTKEADECQTMLKEGRLLVDDSKPNGEIAGSSTDPFHITRNTVTIFIYQQSFAPNFGTASPTARFNDNVGLSATLIHEDMHALHQGVAFKVFYPSAIESHAYGKELRYLHALETHAKNPGQLAAIQSKIESLAVPTNESFSDRMWDAASAAADGVSNAN